MCCCDVVYTVVAVGLRRGDDGILRSGATAVLSDCVVNIYFPVTKCFSVIGSIGDTGN